MFTCARHEGIWNGGRAPSIVNVGIACSECLAARSVSFTPKKRTSSNSLTTWSRVLPEKLIFRQLLKKFHAFYGTRRFITAFTIPRHVRGLCVWFVTRLRFYGENLWAPYPNPKLEDYPLSAVRDCLFSIFVATLHIWRPFLHPQTEKASCRGDRNPRITGESVVYTTLDFRLKSALLYV
jgi:hypothetical protein